MTDEFEGIDPDAHYDADSRESALQVLMGRERRIDAYCSPMVNGHLYDAWHDMWSMAYRDRDKGYCETVGALDMLQEGLDRLVEGKTPVMVIGKSGGDGK